MLYFRLNKDKIRFCFYVTSAVLGGLVLCILMYAFYIGELPALPLLACIMVSALIVFPLFVNIVVAIDWMVKDMRRTKLFRNFYPNVLAPMGFKPDTLYENTRFLMTERAYSKEVDGVKIYVKEGADKKFLELFTANSYPLHLTWQEMKSMPETDLTRLLERLTLKRGN